MGLGLKGELGLCTPDSYFLVVLVTVALRHIRIGHVGNGQPDILQLLLKILSAGFQLLYPVSYLGKLGDLFAGILALFLELPDLCRGLVPLLAQFFHLLNQRAPLLIQLQEAVQIHIAPSFAQGFPDYLWVSLDKFQIKHGARPSV